MKIKAISIFSHISGFYMYCFVIIIAGVPWINDFLFVQCLLINLEYFRTGIAKNFFFLFYHFIFFNHAMYQKTIKANDANYQKTKQTNKHQSTLIKKKR